MQLSASIRNRVEGDGDIRAGLGGQSHTHGCVARRSAGRIPLICRGTGGNGPGALISVEQTEHQAGGVVVVEISRADIIWSRGVASAALQVEGDGFGCFRAGIVNRGELHHGTVAPYRNHNPIGGGGFEAGRTQESRGAATGDGVGACSGGGTCLRQVKSAGGDVLRYGATTRRCADPLQFGLGRPSVLKIVQLHPHHITGVEGNAAAGVDGGTVRRPVVDAVRDRVTDRSQAGTIGVVLFQGEPNAVIADGLELIAP